MRRLRILTWNVHSSYLYYLTQVRHDFFLPVNGYGGRGSGERWGDNVHDVPAEEVRDLEFDLVLFQSRKNYLEDQYRVLSEAQRQRPRIYLEHDPPREHPTDTRHLVDDPETLLVHVTHFNNLMWDSGATPVRVIEHGVLIPEGARYSGELARGLVVINNLRSWGRRLGSDLFARARDELPLDLIGLDAEALGGLEPVPHYDLPHLMARYRLLFNPIRYTSLGLAVCEAMMVGLPIVGLATTEMVTVIENGVSGHLDTDPRRLTGYARELLQNPAEARRLGEGARRVARERFDIARFSRDWDEAFAAVTRRDALNGDIGGAER